MIAWGCESLSIRRGSAVLLDGVTFNLAPGRVTAVLGPNGSGKTTLLRALAGALKPDAGSIHAGATARWTETQWAQSVSCALEAPLEDLPFCVEEILLASRFPDGGRWLDPSPERRRPLEALLARLEVFSGTDGLERAYASLSAGERQLVDVARAVLQATPLLLLDEPTSALDLRHRLLLTRLLADEAARGRTVVLSLHDLGEASAFDDALVLHRGRLVASGPPAKILKEGLLGTVWGVAPAASGFRLLGPEARPS